MLFASVTTMQLLQWVLLCSVIVVVVGAVVYVVVIVIVGMGCVNAMCVCVIE